MHRNFVKESNSIASIEAGMIDKEPDGFISKNKVYLVICEWYLLFANFEIRETNSLESAFLNIQIYKV